MPEGEVLLASANGWPATTVFSGATNNYGYDDLVFMPAAVTFEADDTDVSGRLTKNIALRCPVVGSPTDTVTGIEMAIRLACIGGIGIIHANQSKEEQAHMVERVKRYRNGFILEPFVLSQTHTVQDVDDIKARMGFSGIVITDTGQIGGKVIGMVTNRDIGVVVDRTTQLSEVMTTKVVCGQEPLTWKEAMAHLHKEKVGKLPILDSDDRLVSMVSRADFKKIRDFPNASRDSNQQLLVGAAITVEGSGDLERAKALVEAGADVLCVDVSEGIGDTCLDFIRTLKVQFPTKDVMAGPVASCREAKYLCDAGIDGLRVGGTSYAAGMAGEIAMVGRGDASSVFNVARYANLNYHVPTIAEGGLHNAGHVLKALVLGASAVMLSDMIAGTEEAQAGLIQSVDGTSKLHHGPRTVQPLHRVPVPGQKQQDKTAFIQPGLSGVCSRLTSRGPVKAMADYIVQCARYGMQDLGMRNLPEMHQAVYKGSLKLEARSAHASQLLKARAQALDCSSCPEVHDGINS